MITILKKFETGKDFPSEWEMIYIDKDNPSPIEVIQEIIKKGDPFGEVIPFKHFEFDMGESSIKNQENLFYVRGKNLIPYVWQVGPKAVDSIGNIIPNTYFVRKIGFCIY